MKGEIMRCSCQQFTRSPAKRLLMFFQKPCLHQQSQEYELRVILQDGFTFITLLTVMQTRANRTGHASDCAAKFSHSTILFRESTRQSQPARQPQSRVQSTPRLVLKIMVSTPPGNRTRRGSDLVGH